MMIKLYYLWLSTAPTWANTSNDTSRDSRNCNQVY